MAKLLIIEDHPMTAMIAEEIFASLIEPHDICYAETMSDLLSLDLSDIDIVLSDLQIPGAEPAEVLDWINSKLPRAKRFFFTSIKDEALIERIRDTGGVYLSKNTKFKEIVNLLQSTLKKNVFRTDAVESRGMFHSLIQIPGAPKPLTIKQAKVIDLLSSGLSIKEIARKVSVSPETIKAHIREAFTRLNVTNGREAVSRFLDAKRMAERLYGKDAVEKSMCE